MRETIFVWDSVNDCVMSELDGSGALQVTYTNEPQQYGGVISQRRGTTTSTYHADALGSTRALTDNSGNVTDTYLNDAWGNSVASTGTTVNPLKWVGKYGYYTDNSTGQVYVRARMYQPTTASFLNPSTPNSTGSNAAYRLLSPTIAAFLGLQHPDNLTPEIFHVSLATAALPCTDAPQCPCKNESGGCDFFIFLSGRNEIDGTFGLSLTFESHPPAERSIFPGGRLAVFDNDHCYGDFGRADTGKLVVVKDGINCEFQQNMFDPNTGEPFPGSIKDRRCRNIISVDPLRVTHRGPDKLTQQQYGLQFNIRPPVDRVSFDFDIEIYCGCGGPDPDGTGRPLHRQKPPGKLNILGTYP